MRVAVVLVTYNRISQLKEALLAYERQTVLPQTVIVVDNASDDGTGEFLSAWAKDESLFSKNVISMEYNQGGAGGFYAGMEYASSVDCDFVFVADDDAYAKEDMIEEAQRFCDEFPEKDSLSAVCASVVSRGQIAVEHRRREKRFLLNVIHEPVPAQEYTKRYFDIDELSFVGAFIKKDAMNKAGLPLRQYFISYDDTEYSVRLKKEGRIICVPSCVMYHDTYEQHNKIGWRNYYVQRNSLDCLKRHYPPRCYRYAVICDYLRRATFISRIIKNRSKYEIQLFKDAITDSVKDRIEVSDKYAPNKHIEENKHI